MTTPDRDLEEFLRRGLHAAAESIEPAPGGLESIRRRVASHRLQRQARLLLADCADLVRLLMIRLEPVLSWLARSARRSTAGVHREGARPGHRLRRPAGARPPADWLRPAMVVATAVVIVVAGVFGLTKLRQQPVTNLSSLSQRSASSSSSSHHARGSVTGTANPAPPRTSQPGVAPASSSSPSRSKSGSPTPKPSCQSGSAGTQAASTATPSPTPTPPGSPSPSPSGSASESPSVTPSGAGSATGGQSGGSAGGSSGSASPSSSC